MVSWDVGDADEVGCYSICRIDATGQEARGGAAFAAHDGARFS